MLYLLRPLPAREGDEGSGEEGGREEAREESEAASTRALEALWALAPPSVLLFVATACCGGAVTGSTGQLLPSLLARLSQACRVARQSNPQRGAAMPQPDPTTFHFRLVTTGGAGEEVTLVLVLRESEWWQLRRRLGGAGAFGGGAAGLGVAPPPVGGGGGGSGGGKPGSSGSNSSAPPPPQPQMAAPPPTLFSSLPAPPPRGPSFPVAKRSALRSCGRLCLRTSTRWRTVSCFGKG